MPNKIHRIVAICQVYNELETNNLQRFFKYIKPIVDEVIIFDDGSTDGSFEYAQKHTKHITRSIQNNFKNELQHKKQLHDYAVKLNADFILCLDADEVLSIYTEKELHLLCDEMINYGFDGANLQLLNLWRSNSWKRTDNLFNEYRAVRLWKVQQTAKTYPENCHSLHKSQHPLYVKNIMNTSSVKIIHYGFSTLDGIIRKYLIYKKHGQKGFHLNRLIDEKNATFEHVPPNILPEGTNPDESAPTPLSTELIVSKAQKSIPIQFKPKVSIVCLIYKSIGWLRFVYEQVLKYTDLTDKEFFFVANDPTLEVLTYLKKNYISHYVFRHNEEVKDEHYISNVYRAWNFGAQKARGDFILFINSDMAFTPNWFENIYKYYVGNNCIALRLVEAGKLRSGQYGIEKSFGNCFSNYRENEFLKYSFMMSEDKIRDGGLFMPLLIRKEHFFSVGGYPEGNISKDSEDIFNPKIAKPGQEAISGDKILMEKLKTINISHQTSFAGLVYHFQEGEMRSTLDSTQTYSSDIHIAVCNDIVTGTMGEKVLWDQLLSNLFQIHGIDKKITGINSASSFKRYINEHLNNVNIIIQNATFMDIVDENRYTIAFLQDNLRAMGKFSIQQERVLQKADMLVANSVHTATSYPEYQFEVIPVGVDDSLFKSMDKNDLKEKHQLGSYKKIGIFVGDLSEVKGWNKVKRCIKKFIDIYWIIISKKDEQFSASNVRMYNRVNQEVLVELLNCSDFFILGSEVETQCLAAIEAALCNIPIIMKPTGIFADIPKEDLERIGIFEEDFIRSINTVYKKTFTPRKTICKYPVTVEQSIEKWKILLCKIKIDALKKEKTNDSYYKENMLNNVLYNIEFVYRKKILLPLLKRDQFYTRSEISVFLRNNFPAIHSFMKKTRDSIKKLSL